MSHIVVTHCIANAGAVALIGRKALPQLKDTLLQMIIDHIGVDISYTYNRSRGHITFENGSKIICFSWADKAYKKVRSYALSCVAIEELTENSDLEFYKEIKMRCGRIPHIKENLIINATNPDSPIHPAYKYFIESDGQYPTRHVYYSLTEQNPFLPKTYIEGLKDTLSPKEAMRMLQGRWIELTTDVIYSNYEHSRNYVDEVYKIRKGFPIDIMFDFNIGIGKPMSAAIGQYIGGVFHLAKSWAVDGVRTQEIVSEILQDDIIINNKMALFRAYGDATGSHRDTRSKLDDWKIIDNGFRSAVNRYERKVPKANPPIRERHNTMNALFLNANNAVRFYVYKDAVDADEGFRLTALKKGSNYIEDDSFRHQHVTTAIGYWCTYITREQKKSMMVGSGSRY